MNDFGSNIMVIPNHEDIFGLPTKSKSQITTEIKQYSSYAILHVCTKLMLLLSGDDRNSAKVQGTLAGELLDKTSVERLRKFLHAHSDSRQIYFHHASVMMLIKINIEENDPNGRDIENENDRAILASWLISLTSQWIPNERIAHRGRKYFYENLRIQMAKQYLQESSDNVINLLARGNYLLSKVTAVESLDFNSIFQKATGLSVDLYIEILFMVMTEWTIKVEGKDLNTIAIRNTEQFFKHTRLTKEEIEAFMNIMSFSIEEYDELKQNAISRIKINDGIDNFIVFIERPLLRYEDNFICISPSYLALKLTEGPYRIVEAALKGKKNENQLADEWSKAYESYVNERLSKAFKSTSPNVKTANSEADNVVSTANCGFIVETKYTHWTFAARISGSRDDMKKYLGRIARYNKWKEKPGSPWQTKKLGLGQIKQFFEDIKDKLETLSLDGKSLVPILVLGEDFPFDPGNRQYIEDYAISQGCIINDQRVLPFITIGSSELELIESFSQVFGEDYVAELISGYSKSLNMKVARQKPIPERSTSLHNYFHATGKTTKNNDFLRTELDKLSKRVIKHMIKPREAKS